MKNIFLFLILFVLLPLKSLGQLAVNSAVTPAQMVNILAGTGVTITNITYTGSPVSRGTFDGSNSNIGLNKGIMLATGNLINAIGPNDEFGAGSNESRPGDPALVPLADNRPTFDASILEFDFIPVTSQLSFHYVFGSEEYPADTNITFNDVFAFFISGPGIAGTQNIALVPSTTDPISIKNVNSTKNAIYYIDNPNGPTVEYNGFTTLLEARATVQPGQTYHLKLTIADTQDRIFDSGVFFEEGSLVSPFAGPDFTVCSGDTVAIKSDTVPGFTAYTWSPATGLSNPNIVNPKFSLINNTGAPVIRGYQLTAANGSGGSIIDSLYVLVNPSPAASINVSAPLCAGDTVRVTYGSNAAVIGTFNWSFTTADFLSGSGAGPYKMFWNGPGTKKVKLGVIALTGCTNKDSVSITVNPDPVVTTSVTPGNSCPGASVVLTASGGASYAWSRAVSRNLVESVSSSYTIFPSVTTGYVVTVTDVNLCTATSQVSASVFPPCVAQIQILGNDTICLGDVVSFTGAGTASSYNWFEKASPGVIKGNGSSFIYNSRLSGIPPVNPWSFVLEGTDNNGCVGKDTVDIFVRSLPAVRGLRSRDTICPGDSVLLTGLGGQSYAWYNRLSPGTLLNSGPSDNLAWVTPMATSTYVLKAGDSFPCENYDTVVVHVRPAPPVSITTASDTICLGKSTVLTATGALNFTWALLSSPGSSISTARNIFVSPVTPTYYLLKGTDKFGCRSSDSLLVHVRDLPVIAAMAAPDSVCPGFPVILQASGGANYLWVNSLQPNLYIGNDSTLTLMPSASATYIVEGTDQYGCSGKDTLRVQLKSKPPGRRITGSAYVCPGLTGVVYRITDTISAAPVSSSTFFWKVINGAPASGQTVDRDSLKVDFSSLPGNARIAVVETNREGCPGDTLFLIVEIKSIFTPPAPSGAVTLCTKDRTGRIYRTPFNTPGSVYTWHISGGIITSGNGTSQVTVEWSGAGAGRIWFEESSATASANCYGYSDTLGVVIKETPDPGSINGRSSLCPGQEIYFLNGHPGSSYEWSAGWGALNAGNLYSQVTCTWNIPGIDTVTVIETAINGCVSDPVRLPVKINPSPEITSLQGNSELCETNPVQQYVAVSGTSETSRFLWSVVNGQVVSRTDNDTVLVHWKISPGLSRSLSVIEISQDSCRSAPTGKAVRLSGNSPYITSVSCLREANAVEISWLSGVKSYPYRLYRRKYQDPGGTDTAWTLIGKDLYAPYFRDTLVPYKAQAYQYMYSAQACEDTVFSRPENTILLKIAGADGNSARLTWNHYRNWREDVARYEIWKRTDEETDYSFLTDAGLDTNAVLSTVTGSEHCFAVKAIENRSAVHAWSSNACLSTKHPVNIPTAFSPNNDGQNDVWVIRNIGSYPACVLEVFNRWGERVFSANGYRNNWDGSFNGKRLPDGTYFYILRLGRLEEGQKAIYNGTVTIAR